jgi:hypothetical protein
VTGGGLYTLSRKEGWRRWVDTPARLRPEPLTAKQLAGLGEDARADYDDARHDWHANFGTIKTVQLAAIHDELDQIVATNRQDPDRVRGAVVIDALPARRRSPTRSPVISTGPSVVASVSTPRRATSGCRCSGSG